LVWDYPIRKIETFRISSRWSPLRKQPEPYQVTDIDLLQYGLLFERFLNPERISMPDLDVDFCTRDAVRSFNT